MSTAPFHVAVIAQYDAAGLAHQLLVHFHAHEFRRVLLSGHTCGQGRQKRAVATRWLKNAVILMQRYGRHNPGRQRQRRHVLAVLVLYPSFVLTLSDHG